MGQCCAFCALNVQHRFNRYINFICTGRSLFSWVLFA